MKQTTIVFMLLNLGVASYCQHKIGSIETVFPAVAFIVTTKVQTQKIDATDWEVYLRNPKNNEVRPLTFTESGTGFIVASDVDAYLVTAQHVAKNTVANTSIFLNAEDGSPIEIKIKQLVDRNYLEGDKVMWISHPTADVSVVPIDPVNRKLIIPIPNEIILNRLEAPLRQRNLIVYGYPLGLGAGKKISPISKKYNPASGLIDLNRFDTNTLSTFFLIDDPSISGLSGGPVVAFPQIIEYDDGSSVTVNGSFILGLVHGTINKDGGGFGAIVPSKFIAETISMAPGYNGKYVYKYPDGKIWSEVIYKNGLVWEVISNNKINGDQQEKGTLKDGNGTRYLYDENGNLLLIKHYKSGVKIKDELNKALPLSK